MQKQGWYTKDRVKDGGNKKKGHCLLQKKVRAYALNFKGV